MSGTSQTTVLQTQTIADSAITSAQTVSFAQFDPSLGTLVDVRLTLVGDVTGSASIENLGATAASTTVGLPSLVNLFLPDGTYVAYAQPDPSATVNLGAFDGTADYSGTSGTVVTGLSGTATDQFVDVVGTTAAAQFSGTGTVPLTVQGTAGSAETGDGNLLTDWQSMTGAVVSLQYDYIAAGGPGSGGGGSDDYGSVGLAGSGPAIFPTLYDPTSIKTTAQTFVVADAKTGWNTLLSVNRFNSALGTLEAVMVGFTADANAQISLENLSSAPISVSATAAADVTLIAGTATVVAQPDVVLTTVGSLSSILALNLGAYDGTADFAGTSGTADVALIGPNQTQNFSFNLTDATDLAAFTGAGTIAVPIGATGTSVVDGSGNMLSQLSDLAGATVSIRYQYAPTVTTSNICFLSGTYITTPTGERLIEALEISDTVVTAGGKTAPIVWIGTGKVLATRGRRSAATPVIVRRGALADNVPNRDLYVTKAHALFIDNVLIPVEFLVNHRSILWDDRAQEVTIFHVELAEHDVLVANGAPAESYRDDGNRWLFQNGNTGWDQPPKPACAPVLTGGPVVDKAWRRLLDRGGPRGGLPLTDNPDLHLLMDGRRVNGRRLGSAIYFQLPHADGDIRIRSRSAIPQELGIARDDRELGVSLRSITVRQGARIRAIQAADPCLTDGFHAHEPNTVYRWTNGNAAVPVDLFAGLSGPIEVILTLAGNTLYADDGRQARVA